MLNITDSSQVTAGIAFLAGLLAFSASCLLPMVPTYLLYLSGTSLSGTAEASSRWRLIKVSLFFVFGFIGTFVLLGSILRFVVTALHAYQQLLTLGMAALFILLGLFVIGLIHPRIFATERKIQLGTLFNRYAWLHALVFGMLFGLGWSPCIGPVLAVILYWSTQAETQITGIIHLLLFGLGLGLPFVLIAAAFEKISPLLHKYRKISYYANIITGILLLMIGLGLVIHTLTPWQLPFKELYPA